MASTGNVFPATGENNAGIGATAWSTPTNIVSDNATDATCNAAASSQYLVARQFDFSSIPNDAQIVGITVRVEASEHSTSTESLNAQLQDAGGALFGSSQAQTISGTGKSVYTYGGTADVWGAALTPAIVKDADFGVRFWFTTAHDVRVDYVTMAVEYQLPPTPHTRTSAPQQTIARERAGFAVVFIAAAAHIPEPPGTDAIGAAGYTVGTHQAAIAQSQPQPWVRGTSPALVPVVAGTDTIGGAQYTGGTHQATLAESQPRPWVRGTPPDLIPAVASSPLTRIVLTVPQDGPNRQPLIWHALIPTTDVVQARLVATSPQTAVTTQPGFSRALIPSDNPLTRIVTAAPQRAADSQPAFSKALIPEPVVGTDTIGSAYYRVGTHRPQQSRPAIFRSLIDSVPEERLFARYYEADQQIIRQPQPYFAKARIDALPMDTPQPRAFHAGRSAFQQPQPVLFRAQIEPLAVATPTAHTLTAFPQAYEYRGSRVFGRVVETTPDTPAFRFVSTAQQVGARSGSQVWHAQISEPVPTRFVWTTPQGVPDGRGWVKSPASEYQELGTDIAIGVFRFSDQRFVPIQYAITSRIAVKWLDLTGTPATSEQTTTVFGPGTTTVNGPGTVTVYGPIGYSVTVNG